MEKVRWGIIGCGDVTEQKSGPAFQKTAHSELVAVMRRNADKAADYAKRHHVPRWYSDAKLLVDDPEVNAVYVATPPSTHAFYSRMAVLAGKPVYIEKPMCRTWEECVEINQLAEEKNIPIFVAYYRRYLPGFLKVKELIGKGEIGDVRMVNVRLLKRPLEKKEQNLPWRVLPEIAGGGHFYDLASHQFDFLDFLFGPIDVVHGVADNQMNIYPAEDVVTVSWKHRSGVLGSGFWCFNSGRMNDSDAIEIIGSKGRIEFSTFDFTPVKLYRDTEPILFPFPKPEHVSEYLIGAIVASLLRGEKVESTGQTAARTNWVLEQVVTNYYKI
ncbi:MAG TPA: Gfo/Idh/MocA family oxidoreductase [Prolixibacteraceae bacterium]|nr:Gfo/Idh/MocA family oxidoreductase [Prolixibacteraceae bacterium]